MNGEPLPPDHGFPARLLVPGWVGIANIKWLGQIEVADHPLFSPWNTTQYRLTGAAYPPDSPPLTNQAVKSAFELPFPATLPAGVPQVLTGRSWSGHRRIRRVDVSIDGGATWHARAGSRPQPEEAPGCTGRSTGRRRPPAATAARPRDGRRPAADAARTRAVQR